MPARGSGTGGPSARGARSRAARPGSACSSPSTPSARARSKPRRELAGETPGMPGSQRSSAPWSTSSRRPRSGSRTAGRGATARGRARASTDGSSAAAIATAPPIEKPSSSVRGRADCVDRRPRVLDAPVEPLPGLDPVPDLGERELAGSAARAAGRATRATRSRCLRPRRVWPPLTQTTAAAARAGPVTRISAPVASCASAASQPESDGEAAT